MKRFWIIGILTLSLLLSGCKDKYCPCYPTDKTEYLPVDYVGQTLRYLIDGDTIAFTVQAPVFSEKYEMSEIITAVQEAHAHIKAISDEGAVLHYGMRLDCETLSTYTLDISLYSETFTTAFHGHSGYLQGEERHHAILPQWTSPTGETYANVGKIADFTDTAYCSPSLGLLHLCKQQGCITLLP